MLIPGEKFQAIEDPTKNHKKYIKSLLWKVLVNSTTGYCPHNIKKCGPPKKSFMERKQDPLGSEFKAI